MSATSACFAIRPYGPSTQVFAVLRDVWLSLVALAIAGAPDTVSMMIRIAGAGRDAGLDAGRVGAVNYLFVNASYQLGGLRAASLAALFGAVPSVLLGGAGRSPSRCSG